MAQQAQYARVALSEDDEEAMKGEGFGPDDLSPGPPVDGVTRARKLFAVGGYMGVSASLLVVNKLSVSYLPMPSLILFSQLLCAAVFTFVSGKLGVIEVDPLSWDTARRFWLVPAVFLLTIFSNIKVLQHSNVETFIVFRASAPLALSVLDALFLERELPSRRAALCLAGILASGVAYMYFESGQLSVNSLFWAITWYVVFCTNQIYIKHVVDNVEMTTWGRVLYTNLMPLGPLLLINFATGEFAELGASNLSGMGFFWLLVSCVFGTLMSFFAFSAREIVSATAFSVIGDACKALTILINVAMWDKHATPPGIFALLVCIACAFFYEQAPVVISPERKAEVRRQIAKVGLCAVPSVLLALVLLATHPSDAAPLGAGTTSLLVNTPDAYGCDSDGPEWLRAIVSDPAALGNDLRLERISAISTQLDRRSREPVMDAGLLPLHAANQHAAYVLAYRQIQSKTWLKHRADGTAEGSNIVVEWLGTNVTSTTVAPDTPPSEFTVGAAPRLFWHNNSLHLFVTRLESGTAEGHEASRFILPLAPEMGAPAKAIMRIDSALPEDEEWIPFSMGSTVHFVRSIFPLRLLALDAASGTVRTIFEQPESDAAPPAWAGRRNGFKGAAQAHILDGRWLWGFGRAETESAKGRLHAQNTFLWSVNLHNLAAGTRIARVDHLSAGKMFYSASLFCADGELKVSGTGSPKGLHTQEMLLNTRPHRVYQNALFALRRGGSSAPSAGGGAQP